MSNKNLALLALSLFASLCIAVAINAALNNARIAGEIAELDRQLADTRKLADAKDDAIEQADAAREHADALRDEADGKAERIIVESRAKDAAYQARLADNARRIAALQAQPAHPQPATLAECVGELARITDISALQADSLAICEQSYSLWQRERDALTTQVLSCNVQLVHAGTQIRARDARAVVYEQQITLLTRKADVALGKRRWFEAILPRPQFGTGVVMGPDGKPRLGVYAGFGWSF